MNDAHLHTAGEVLSALDTTAAGLTDARAGERRERFGPNALRQPEKPTPLQRFVRQLKDPMLLILLAAAGDGRSSPRPAWTPRWGASPRPYQTPGRGGSPSSAAWTSWGRSCPSWCWASAWSFFSLN